LTVLSDHTLPGRVGSIAKPFIEFTHPVFGRERKEAFP